MKSWLFDMFPVIIMVIAIPVTIVPIMMFKHHQSTMDKASIEVCGKYRVLSYSENDTRLFSPSYIDAVVICDGDPITKHNIKR